MWEKLDNKLLICYALTTLAGIGLHFVFDLWPSLLTGAVLILCGLIVCWTIQPPNAAIFHDLSLADAFYQLPC